MEPLVHALAAAPVVIALTPFERPDLKLLATLTRSDCIPVLDLGRDPSCAAQALEALARESRPCGVRVHPETCRLALPDHVSLRVVPDVELASTLDHTGFDTLVQVTSEPEARAAAALGSVVGLIVKGSEAGGRVGSESAFVLLQRIAASCSLPLFVQGGIGLHSAAAAIAGGACGVVVDSQLALMPEAETPASVRRWLEKLDGSEVLVADGFARIEPKLRTGDGTDAAARDAALAAGQDIAFAAPLRARFGRTQDLLSALRRAAYAYCRQASALLPLSPSSTFARAHGAHYPIVQGPMTRVSDRPAFAAQVAEAGAIPFVALSLLAGEQARALLRETADALGSRPWGVGVLGFAPPALREEQLALIEAVKPPLALIAGGRPAQARALDQAGIATFLHVPSPALLEHFLADGARRFVFEGRECGGHVGPRSSFVLWQQAIAVLLASDVAHECELLFAGGIHDARSAAMVSALCAELYARGARVGVLMGTAYLFTREAVATGAIVEAFQERALQCETTALLQTAPGHATRTALTEYVGEFEHKSRALLGRADAQAAWVELETLNVGRLRLASKGLLREGDTLAAVDAETQRREGLYMMGQVAALRSSRTTLSELHADVSLGASRQLAQLELSAPLPGAGRPLEIAVIGMACVLPDAKDLDSYWRNILQNRDCVREVPESRWDRSLYYDPAGGRDRTRSKWGAFLPKIVFEPQRYGIPPQSIGSIDPGQLLSLHVVREALLDAGLEDRDFDHQRSSVIFGAEHGSEITTAYVLRCALPQLLGSLPAAIDAQLPDLTEDSFPGALANVIAGRISNRLDFGGVNYTVNAACASSLAALDAACKELVLGHSDLVVAGATDVHNGIYDYLMFSSVQALSPHGRCKSFDAGADGIVLGEGVTALVLKRLDDARRDGDRVYAVIKAVAGASDGRCLGLTAPRKEGQRRALERAYELAGVSASEIGLLEAHGTGTVVGDRTELMALTEVFTAAGSMPQRCVLGSVKSQIGHTKCAAGMAGLIKAILSAYHGVLPPTHGLTQPNPYYRESTSPFRFCESAQPWQEPRRRAAVSAFGFGGTNFHAVIESDGAAEPVPVLRNWPAELFLIRGATPERAARAVQQLLALASQEPECYALAELAASANLWQRSTPVRAAFVASSHEELCKRLRDLLSNPLADPVPAEGKVAFLFPGQGSQRPNALSQFFVLDRRARRWLEPVRAHVPYLFPARAFDAERREAQRRALADTRVAQPLLAALELALCEWLERCGVHADMAAGHSFGELVALGHAGAFEPDVLAELARARAEAILSALGDDRGAMAAVSASAEQVQRALDGIAGVVLANLNAPEQVVISGATSAVQAACERLRRDGMQVQPLAVGCAFHSPLLRGAERHFRAALDRVDIQPCAIPVWSNVTATEHTQEPATLRDALAEHLIAPVRFEAEVRAMYAAGARTFIEVGPGRVLSGLVARTLEAEPHRVIALDGDGDGRLQGMLRSLAELAVAQLPVDPTPLFAERGITGFDLEQAKAREPSPAAVYIDGQYARPLRGEPAAYALKPLRRIAPTDVPLAASDDEQSVLQYLKNMQSLAEAQRDVMLRLLAQGALPAFEPTAIPVTTQSANSGRADPDCDQTALLVAIISDRTGYPAEMLDLDLDLEADLGIDSIKRVEILNTLATRLGPARAPGAGVRADAMIESLARMKTLRAMKAWLEQSTRAVLPILPADAEPDAVAPEREHGAIQRFVPRSLPLAETHSNGLELRSLEIAIVVDDRGVADALAPLLEKAGARVFRVEPGGEVAACDVLVHLEALGKRPNDTLGSLFRCTQAALRHGARAILSALPRDRPDANALPSHTPRGLGGFMKSVAQEQPGLHARLVELDPGATNEVLAGTLARELTLAGPVEVQRDSERRSVRPMPESLVRNSPRTLLGPDAVVLLTGGARGITAHVSIALARRFGCALEIVGRSPAPPAAESRDTAGCREPVALRRALIARAGADADPREIERDCRLILAEREMRATFEAIAAAGSPLSYHALDVRDAPALRTLIDDVYRRHGRLSGVIHGAGVIEDALLADKDDASFARVVATKVVAAQTIAACLRGDAQFLAFFASISGVFGNRGQADYAAANASLDRLAHALAATRAYRVLSVDWGPWSGGGMLTPELERMYRARGIALISPAEGVDAFLAELLYGQEPQVILAASLPEALEPS